MSTSTSIPIVPGETTFRSTYADGNPLWRITGRAGRGAWYAVSEDDMDYSGIRKAFTTDEVRRALQWQSNVSRVFADHDRFWETIPLDSIVHYHDSFGRYVRGTVKILTPTNSDVPHHYGQRGIVPTALVGAWAPNDLPHRDNHGDITAGYQARKIHSGDGGWQPSHTCMVEGTHRLRADEPDPRTLEPLDLSDPPELTGDDARAARILRIRRQAFRDIEALHSYTNGPTTTDELAAGLEEVARKILAGLDTDARTV